MAVWKLELPNWVRTVRISLQSDGCNERTRYHILNEIAIMVKKIITMMIMIINRYHNSNDIKDDEDIDNRYDSI